VELEGWARPVVDLDLGEGAGPLGGVARELGGEVDFPVLVFDGFGVVRDVGRPARRASGAETNRARTAAAPARFFRVTLVFRRISMCESIRREVFYFLTGTERYCSALRGSGSSP